MSILRSQTMSLFQLIMTRETAWATMTLIGQLSELHIVPPPQLSVVQGPFSSHVKRIHTILDHIECLKESIIAKKKPIFLLQGPQSSSNIECLLREWADEDHVGKEGGLARLEDMEHTIEDRFRTFTQLEARHNELLSKLNENNAKRLTFRGAQKILGDSFLNRQENRKVDFSLLGQNRNVPLFNVDYFALIVKKTECTRFQKLVFRVSRGNALVQMVDCEELGQHEGFEENTICFVVYQVGQIKSIEQKLKKIVQSFALYEFDLPDSNQQFLKKLASLEIQLSESKHLSLLLQKEIEEFLDKLIECPRTFAVSLIEEWRAYMLKEKSIFEKLNEFTINNDFIYGKVWVPTFKAENVRKEISSIVAENVPQAVFQEIREHDLTPPTYFRDNQFLNPSQLIVDTYGVPRYKEANPALFTAVTFPFLFGVMFGDMSLGSLLFLMGLSLIVFKKHMINTPLELLMDFRYLITLMGFFAFYCGFIYNDFICLSFNIFGSCYTVPPFPQDEGQELTPAPDCVYPAGLDPVWSRSSNQLNYINSLKMKLSVILGVSHMMLGIFLKGANSFKFRKWLDFFFQFVPQIVFMVVLFVYMDFLIVFKWCKKWTQETIPYAPSIITTMINIPLKLGHTTQGAGGEPLWGDYQTTSQNLIQLILLLIAVVCVPLMLLPKPIILKLTGSKQHKSSSQQASNSQFKPLLLEESQLPRESIVVKPGGEEHDELFVHQVIQTIEFVLGSVSNTASYLRLWALSLAHEQLSQVFFEKTIQDSIGKGFSGILGMLLGYLVYSMITFGVLYCMDSMQCFLHALRLHWVQFQNKFFKGDGIKFQPYSFRRVIQSNSS